MPKIIALDPGTKRIGIAISDESQTLAFARDIAPNTEEGLQSITDLYFNENAEKIIIGKPLHEGPHYPGFKIAEYLKSKGIQTEFVEEDFSTAKADELIKQANSDKIYKDDIAAQKILETYLKD